MLSQIPILLDRIDKANLEKEILRTAIIAELDAVNLYEQMAAMTRDREIKAVLLDIAKEEKTHRLAPALQPFPVFPDPG